MEDDEEQIKVKDVIPTEYQSIFPFEKFNEMQSSLFKQIYESDANITVAAPTGSGKTVVCELAILRLLKKYGMTDLKCIMITPNKALCQQKMKEWNSCFGSLGLSVLELTGDSMFEHSLRLVARANIIITTPEKWDCMYVFFDNAITMYANAIVNLHHKFF
jgi:ATP-dependent DNA helicase HFM1/MER3